MPHLSRRTVAAFILAALVCLPTVTLAAPLGHAQEATRASLADSDVFSRIWGLLQHIWGEEGMSIDPNGSHARATPGGTHVTHLSGKEGMMIDPNGTHTSATGSHQVSTDSGMSIDPDGSH